jgi:CBS-domain-containing membrane protein
MQAKDIMTANVETVRPDTEAIEIAQRLIARNISAVPVVDDSDRVVGIVSEGDLIHHSGDAPDRQPSWWIRLFAETKEHTPDYAKSHGLHANDIMSRDVISVDEDMLLADIAETLEKHHIKRVPVVRGDRLVGIVSRANLLQGLVAAGTKTPVSARDRDIKAAIEAATLKPGLTAQYFSVVVADGVATIWGVVDTEVERSALIDATAAVTGVSRVDDHINILPV